MMMYVLVKCGDDHGDVEDVFASFREACAAAQSKYEETGVQYQIYGKWMDKEDERRE